jgi:hypothetical protein
MTPRISSCLDHVRIAMDLGVTGVPMDADHFRRMSALLVVCTDIVRQMEAKLCLQELPPELFAGTNVVSLKDFLEAKSHVQSQA